ncbi:MAG: sugar phosphate isomerase/epimerase family protein [Rhodothermales bacterium]
MNMIPENRRDFLKKVGAASLGLSVLQGSGSLAFANAELFKISLAQWSLNPLLFSGKMDNLDFARDAKKHGIYAIEYVNQFFKDKAEDKAYVREMRNRADGEGVTSVLIMCDGEGKLGAPDKTERLQAVDNHKKWVQAAKGLGCHMIRVNGFSMGGFGERGDYDEEMKLVADGLRRLCEYADDYDMNVTIENHGGNSSNGKWLSGVMELADHPRAGTLPDFGNFQMVKGESYDSYRGVKELMRFATGVSVKPRVWDDDANESDLDYERMMRIVLDAGYRGYCGIEYGPKGMEWEGIMQVKEKLEATKEALAGDYS